MHFKNYLQLAALSSALFFQSCGDDGDSDEPLDTTNPEITISGIENDEAVWNNLAIQASATDDIAIASIELYLDNELLKSDETTGSINTEWDTNDYEDGQHTIKVVATDNAGNKAEKEVSFEIKNVLVTLKSAADLMDSGQSGIVFLSDLEGKIIIEQTITSGQTIEIRKNDYDGTEFFLTEIFGPFEDDTKRLTTYEHIERGQVWNVSHRSIDHRHPQSSRTVKVENMERNAHYKISTAYNLRDVNRDEIAIPAYDGIYDFIVIKQNSRYVPVAYHLYNNVVDGSNIDLSQVTSEFDYVDISFPKYQKSMCYIYGYNDSFNERVQVCSERAADKSVSSFPYTGDTFENYQIHISWYNNSSGFDQYTYGIDDYEINVVEQNFNLELKDDMFSYSADGSFDYMKITFYITNENPDYDTPWEYVLSGGENREIPLLEIPESLNGAEFLPEYGNRYFYDVDDMENYEDLKEFIGTSTYGYYDTEHTEGLGYSVFRQANVD